MFLGHIAVGFASKRVAPRTSLGWLMTAPVLADLLWPVFLILGIERVRIVPGATPFTPLDFERYPWSHSLLMLVVWGLAMALHSIPATVTVEALMMIAGLWLYLATTRARSLAGHLSLWSFVALLVLAYLGSSFGPPPPSVAALRTVGLVIWLLVPWAFWIDRSRTLRAAPD